MSEDQSQGRDSKEQAETPKESSAAPAYVPDPARMAHLNQLHRRGIALVIDFLLYELTIGIPLRLVVEDLAWGPQFELEDDLVYQPLEHFIAIALGFGLVRGLFRDASPGQRRMGLKVVRATDASSRASYLQRMTRSIFLAFPPGSYILEYLVANSDQPQRRRLADRMLGTRVVDQPSKSHGPKGSLYGAIMIAIAILVLSRSLATPAVEQVWLLWLP